MQIQPITEEAHNTALLTLTAERQELLFYRSRVIELEKIIGDQAQSIAKLNSDLQEAKNE